MATETPFPKTLQQAVLYFNDPERADRFLIEARWPNGPVCPRCGETNIAPIKSRRLLRCRACQKQFSVKLGSIFEDSPLGLDKWLVAVWLLTNAKNGCSSWELHRSLGVTQKTAWFMLHRIRTAMQAGSFDRLSGEVEVDETYVGGKAKNMHNGQRQVKGRGVVGKAVVMGLLARNTPERPSQVRTKVVTSTKKRSVHVEVRRHVAPGSHLYTDALKSYEGLDDFTHEVIDHLVSYVEGRVHTNGMENFWAIFDRCIGGTYISVDPDHLYRYAGEQTPRFNVRKSDDQGRFKTVMAMISGKRLTYAELTARPEGAAPRRGRRPKAFGG